jgi:hypothetical protein
MAQSFDPAPLKAFFEEVEEQLGIHLKYHPDNPKFPIQLESPEGISRLKCVELLQFIKGQVDLRDNEIGELYASKKGGGKYIFEVSLEATHALADVYAMSMFYPHEDEEESAPAPVRQPKKPKKVSQDEQEPPSKKNKGGTNKKGPDVEGE